MGASWAEDGETVPRYGNPAALMCIPEGGPA